MNLKSVRVVVVGSGRMAREHFIAIEHHDCFKVVGLAARPSAGRASLEAEFGIPHTDSDIFSIIEKSNPDIIIVAVSVEATLELLTRILQWPGMVLAEKPLGLDLAEARYLATAAGNRENVFVAMNRRHYRGLSRAHALLSLSDAPRRIRVLDQEDIWQQRSRGIPNAVVSNWMYANSIHLIDLARWFGRGLVENVETSGLRSIFGSQFVEASVKFSSGDTLTFQSAWNLPGPWSFNVADSRYEFHAEPLEVMKIRDVLGSSNVTYEDDPGFLDVKAGLLGQLDAILKELAGEPGGLVSWKEYLASAKLVEAIFFPRWGG